MTLRSLKNLNPVVHDDQKIISAFMHSPYYKSDDYSIKYTSRERLRMFVKSPTGMYCTFCNIGDLDKLYKIFIMIKNELPVTLDR